MHTIDVYRGDRRARTPHGTRHTLLAMDCARAFLHCFYAKWDAPCRKPDHVAAFYARDATLQLSFADDSVLTRTCTGRAAVADFYRSAGLAVTRTSVDTLEAVKAATGGVKISSSGDIALGTQVLRYTRSFELATDHEGVYWITNETLRCWPPLASEPSAAPMAMESELAPKLLAATDGPDAAFQGKTNIQSTPPRRRGDLISPWARRDPCRSARNNANS